MSLSLVDTIPDEDLIPADEETEVRGLRERLRPLGRFLTRQQREVLALRYGRELSFEEIARRYEMSRQRVHTVHKSALTRLRKYGPALRNYLR